MEIQSPYLIKDLIKLQKSPINSPENQSTGRKKTNRHLIDASRCVQTVEGQRSRIASYIDAVNKEKTLQKFRASLYYDQRTRSVPKTTIRNNVIEEIVRESDVIFTNKQFLQSIYKLKDIGLLKNYQQRVYNIKETNHKRTIQNDYHSKSTNNGYSRNFGGLFFNR